MQADIDRELQELSERVAAAKAAVAKAEREYVEEQEEIRRGAEEAKGIIDKILRLGLFVAPSDLIAAQEELTRATAALAEHVSRGKRTKCNYCDRLADYELSGMYDDGDENYPSKSLLCAEHIAIFVEWDRAVEAGEEPPLLPRGWTWVDAIKPLGEK